MLRFSSIPCVFELVAILGLALDSVRIIGDVWVYLCRCLYSTASRHSEQRAPRCNTHLLLSICCYCFVRDPMSACITFFEDHQLSAIYVVYLRMWILADFHRPSLTACACPEPAVIMHACHIVGKSFLDWESVVASCGAFHTPN